MSNEAREGYYPEWLTDTECGNEYKRKLVAVYDEYYKETDKTLKQEKLNEFRVYLTIVSDVVAYRYLVKHYMNLFHKLNMTVEEYLDYKVERMFTTIRDKKERVNDIMSYVYMSFMLSSPRLIYDCGEHLGRCKMVREVLPYFKTQRLKFYFIEKDNTAEHIVFSVDNIDLDEESELLHSNLDKYSLSVYTEQQRKESADTGFDVLREYISKRNFKYSQSKKYLLELFDSWKERTEDDYEWVKQTIGVKNDVDFTLFDYIRYKYENKQIDLTYEEYLDVLSVLNSILKGRKNSKL